MLAQLRQIMRSSVRVTAILLREKCQKTRNDRSELLLRVGGGDVYQYHSDNGHHSPLFWIGGGVFQRRRQRTILTTLVDWRRCRRRQIIIIIFLLSKTTAAWIASCTKRRSCAHVPYDFL